MNPYIDFGIFVVILLFIGNEVTQVKRKLDELDEKLGHLQIDGKRISDGLRDSLQDVRRDLQKECRDVGKDLHEDLHDDFDTLRNDVDAVRESIRSDLKHEIEMHEIRTSD